MSVVVPFPCQTNRDDSIVFPFIMKAAFAVGAITSAAGFLKSSPGVNLKCFVASIINEKITELIEVTNEQKEKQIELKDVLGTVMGVCSSSL